MSINYDIIEVTKENEDEFLYSIVELEKLVLDKMEKEGKIGQLFITGKEGIRDYIESKSNHVIIARRNNDKKETISAVYITQGQTDFTYNDITKYFKCDESYQEYVKSKYPENEFEKKARKVYIEKICAFRYARDIILEELGLIDIPGVNETKRNAFFLELIQNEIDDPTNRFHEKSKIRENLNKYMSLYMKFINKDIKSYQEFYWVDLNYLVNHFGRVEKSRIARQTKYASTMETYDKILQYQTYKIYDKSNCQDISKYYNANTENTIELDTYITHPRNREKGLARILVLEGIKKSFDRLLKNEDNKEVFLVSTLHEDNLSSKYVSEFFGLKDYLFVNRRVGRDRQVHIYGMKREEVKDYIEMMEKKIAVLYGYNPQNIEISNEEQRKIIGEQLQYEIEELTRLKNIKNVEKNKKYAGYIKCKQSKINQFRRWKKRLEGNVLQNDSEITEDETEILEK